MTRAALFRGPDDTAPQVKLLHVGLGNFFRAHQCSYTDLSADGAAWPIAAFTGTLPGTTDLVGDLQAQDGLYTLLERGPERDRLRVIRSLRRVHPAADDEAWLGYWQSPALAAVTITITEAGYAGDAPRRILNGLQTRMHADAGPIALVPCDNVPGNGELLQRIITQLADKQDPQLLQWVSKSVSIVSTMVDRITPRITDADRASVNDQSDFQDRCPVVTEPFSEWVLAGDFPAGRPQWETAGASFSDDVTPHENRKLRLLNGAHSLLAYAGSIRGHATVTEAINDDRCREWVTDWWDAAATHLVQPQDELATYRTALLTRFGNARLSDRLDRIAADGSQKLPIRIIPTLKAERAAGRTGEAATRVLAAWICHLQGLGAKVTDVHAPEIRTLAHGEQPVVALLNYLSPGLGDDAEVVTTTREQCRQFRA